MSSLAPAIRLRRRQLDALALTLAAEQARLVELAGETETLGQRRSAERHLVAVAPVSCDPWFAEDARRLHALGQARAASERRLADLRQETVQARARLQLLEDAAVEAERADRRRQLAKADAALDDRIASAWARS